ncbi:MAG: hypothetical protein ACOYLN_09405 [Blastocatellia bacterium]
MCAEARRLAAGEGGAATSAVASRYGVEVVEEHWQAAGGRMVYLAECSIEPRRIVLNRGVIDLIEERGTGIFRSSDAVTCGDIVVAHELYHLIARRPSSPVVELEAHVFARALTGWKYSPLILEHILRTGS